MDFTVNSPRAKEVSKETRSVSPTPVGRFNSAMPHLCRSHVPATDIKVSIVLIVYKMAMQAEKTLYSLSTHYQRGVTEDDYEIIVVENNSSAPIAKEKACQFGGNIRYFCREEQRSTPVFAVNFGAKQASGSHICIMIDGARMVTPGLISNMLAACRLSRAPVVAVPGYHLGHELQRLAILKGYNSEQEQALLDSISWPEDGYRLFDIACLGGTSAGGFFKPIGESNCVCVSQETYHALGGFDEAFTEIGGGLANLDYYKRAVELDGTELFLLPGEGTFHQLHGGVTTETTGEQRDRTMALHFAEYTSLRGEPYSPPQKRAIYLGAVPDSALRFIRHGTNEVLATDSIAGKFRAAASAAFSRLFRLVIPEQIRSTLRRHARLASSKFHAAIRARLPNKLRKY